MTRGMELCNPGNLRIGLPAFQWEWTPSKDPEFRQFKSMLYGIRAIAETLLTYHKVHGLNTIRQMISRWAPAADNNPTDAYIENVCQACGMDPDASLDMTDAGIIEGLVTGIIKQENGSLGDITPEDITAAVALVLA